MGMEKLTEKEIQEVITEAVQLRKEAIEKIRDLTTINPLEVEDDILEWATIAYQNYCSIVELRKVAKEVRARKREEEAQAILSKYD